MVEFPPVYRPKPYNKPTAHLKSHLQVLLDDGAEIATFVYTPHASAGEKPCLGFIGFFSTTVSSNLSISLPCSCFGK